MTLIDFEILETIHAKVGEKFQRIRSINVQIRHMVRLIKQRAGFTPGALFVSPVGELMTYDRKRIRPNLRITQHVDWITSSLQFIF